MIDSSDSDEYLRKSAPARAKQMQTQKENKPQNPQPLLSKQASAFSFRNQDPPDSSFSILPKSANESSLGRPYDNSDSNISYFRSVSKPKNKVEYDDSLFQMIDEMEKDENQESFFSTMQHKIGHKETFAVPVPQLDMPMFRTVETMDTPMVNMRENLLTSPQTPCYPN